MRGLLAALAIVAGACVAFGPDSADAGLRAKRDCTTPKVTVPPTVQSVPTPVTTLALPPTVVETPPQTVTIPGQTVTLALPPQTVTLPGQAVTLPGQAVTLQGGPVMQSVPICPDEQPREGILQRILEQRKLKRVKHQGMEEAAPADEHARCKGGKCKKRWRWDQPETPFA